MIFFKSNAISVIQRGKKIKKKEKENEKNIKKWKK